MQLGEGSGFERDARRQRKRGRLVNFDDTLLPTADGVPDSLAPAVDPNLGTVLQERYRIVRKLGEGGMGRVYEGEHILIKRRVAIKCLHAQYATDAEVVARFHREALAATSIGNEHIVEVTDMGRFPDGAVYMVLEFLEGRDLGDEIDANGPLAVGRAVRITRQICDALSAAHGKGIIHRDLKPENVYLIRRGRDSDFVKVLDFGISKFRDGTDGAKTGTGVMIGTPHTMAPEQIEGLKDIDHRLDIYAIGVILYMALIGAPPFQAETIRCWSTRCAWCRRRRCVRAAPMCLRHLSR
jgi:serine/threonine protein kinase